MTFRKIKNKFFWAHHPDYNFCFSKIVRMIVGEYEQRAVCKSYSAVGNGPDSVPESSDAIYRVN